VSRRPLVLVAHGTRSSAGRDRVRALRAQVQELLPARAVLLGHVDVEEPHIEAVLTAAGAGADVVPLFLSAGMHVRRDVLDAARTSHDATVHTHLGERPVVEDLLAEAAAEAPGHRRLVLASAGSSHEEARAEVLALADRLTRRTEREVVAGFLGGPGPCAAELAVGSTGLLTHLFAPGHFADRVAAIGRAHGIPVSGPLLGTDTGVERIARALVGDLAAS
jgi:sirohydrochlorin ferrochelatase